MSRSITKNIAVIILAALLHGCIGLQVNIYGDSEAARMCREVDAAASKNKPQADDPGAVYR